MLKWLLADLVVWGLTQAASLALFVMPLMAGIGLTELFLRSWLTPLEARLIACVVLVSAGPFLWGFYNRTIRRPMLYLLLG